MKSNRHQFGMSACYSRAIMSVSMLVGSSALSPLHSAACPLQKGRRVLSRKKLPHSDLLFEAQLTSTREELNHLHILLISHQWTIALVAAIIKEVCMTFSLPTTMAEAPPRAPLSQHLQSSTLPPPLASKPACVRLKAKPHLPVLHR